MIDVRWNEGLVYNVSPKEVNDGSLRPSAEHTHTWPYIVGALNKHQKHVQIITSAPTPPQKTKKKKKPQGVLQREEIIQL